jgi:hypothetical protein
LLFVLAPAIAVAAGVFVATAAAFHARRTAICFASVELSLLDHLHARIA